MSSNQDLTQNSDRKISIKLHICLFSEDKELVHSAQKLLNKDIYHLSLVSHQESLVELIENQREKIDCLLVSNDNVSRQLLSQLGQLGLLFPAVIAYSEDDFSQEQITLYHPAEVKFSLVSAEKIDTQINLALTNFLNLSPHAPLKEHLPQNTQERTESHNLLALQQHRLAEKLQERLGYLGVYYKRNSQDFYQNLTKSQQKQLHQQLATDYRKIILSYFEDESNINQIIDRFVNQAFFADISVSQILEIHMELMDEFAQQLKLEGRSEDILLDYRLAVIDIVAHLCEMYRRSIPREDVSLDI
ncbi:Circadian clock protein KaiA [Hyella patelloides LEGE 07179]|uniref:Circadian clock oscillator protein KaiA n=1 Tax=Hyella patelloides LEGE 07179 TaxID=945734 RepID=A0A563W4W2_9CYAN|nr:circadian clock protein KaiA [Hyella patelloides]VEP18739.1 Circadian clock protein KaiA [Hyella patelloides LEGE 07179]